MFSATPNPPSTTAEPLVTLVDPVVAFALITPVALIVPPAKMFSATPTPPAI